MICGGRIYKGQDNYIELYVPDASGITGIEIYTGGELKITPEEYEIVDDNTIGINLTKEELDPLKDGVIYYTVTYDGGSIKTNSNYYLKTPVGYTASTLDELIEEAYEEGYEDGQEHCTGETCEGVYESGYTDGYESGYTEGYESGSTSGYEEGYASGSTDGYNSGHTDGEAEQKAKLTSTSITENNIYTRDDGWNYVTVNVPQTGHTDEELHDAYNSGFTQGEAAQKAKLVSTAFTENRLYFREDGFSTVSVNVPQTGYTQQDLDNAYASGKTDGYDSGYTEGYNGGYTDGYNQGTADGYQTGYAEGEEAGYQTGYSAGEEAGYHSGYTDGYQSGYTRGTGEGYQSGYTDGYDSGYTDGLVACSGSTNDYFTVTNISNSASSVSLITHGSPSPVTFRTSTDGIHWGQETTYTGGTTNFPIPAGGSLMFDGSANNGTLNNPTNFFSFVEYTESPIFKVSGDISTLIGLPADQTPPDGAFFGLFQNWFSLADASDLVLPYESVSIGCYCYMFWACHSLTGVPELPATVLAKNCYQGMFAACSAITSTPELPATTIVEGCYRGMFESCTSLTTAPVLSASTLAKQCYQGMFSSCTNLNYIKCLGTGITTGFNAPTYGWLSNASQTGTFVKAAGVTWPSGDSGIPSGWAVIDAS